MTEVLQTGMLMCKTWDSVSFLVEYYCHLFFNYASSLLITLELTKILKSSNDLIYQHPKCIANCEVQYR